MIQLRVTFGGLFGRVKRGGTADWVKAESREALKDATQEWVTGRQSPSLRDRFGPGAYNRYGFTRRVPEYEKAQKRVLGAAQPYASPRGLNFMRAALAISSGQGDPRKVARIAYRLAMDARKLYSGPPMRTAVFRAGGHTIRVTGGTTVLVRLTLPGARNLNRGGAKNQIYKDQLLDLDRGGGRDRRWIYQRLQELMQERVWGPIADHNASSGRAVKFKGLRGVKRQMKLLGGRAA